jgi:hypothetical protein
MTGTGAANALTFTVSEANYSGTFTVTTPNNGNSCSGIATVSPGSGTSATTFTVTPQGPGLCDFTVADTNSQTATESIGVTTTTIGGQSKQRKP